MSWPARIAALLALALALAAAGWRIHVKADAGATARILGEQAQAALAATEKRMLDERALSMKNQEITNEYIAEKSRRAAADLDTDRLLRDYQAALDSATRADAAARSGLVEALATVAGECGSELKALGAHAGALAATAGALQDYARKVCVAPP